MHRRTCIFTFILGIMLVGISSSSLAAPTHWPDYSANVEDAAETAVKSFDCPTCSEDGLTIRKRMEFLGEFPNKSEEGQWMQTHSMHAFPLHTRNKYPITELNNADYYCGTIRKWWDKLQDADQKIYDAFITPLGKAIEIAKLIFNMDDFRSNETNASYFETIAETEANIEGNENLVEGFEAQIATLEPVIEDLEEEIDALSEEFSKLDQEAREGYPTDNPSIILLVAKIEELEDDIEKLESDIATFEPLVETAPALAPIVEQKKKELEEKQNELEQKKKEFDALVLPYREEMRIKADKVRAKIDEAESKLVQKKEQLDSIRASIERFNAEIIEWMTDPKYREALAGVKKYTVMLESFTALYDIYSMYRDSVMADATVAINIAKQNFNDLAKIDAGYSSGTFAIFDEDMEALISHIGSSPNVNMVHGEIMNLSVESPEGELLSSPPIQMSLSKWDEASGTYTTVDDAQGISLLPSLANTTYQGYTMINILKESLEDVEYTHPSIEATPEGETEQSLTAIHAKVTSGMPFVVAKIGLLTYCGNLEKKEVRQPQYDQTVYGDYGGQYQFSILRTIYDYKPQTFLPVPINYTYERRIQLKPSSAKCNIDIDIDVRNWHDWGYKYHRRVKNFLFWRSVKTSYTRWNNQEIAESFDNKMVCTFIQESDVSEEETNYMNQQAVIEAYANMILAIAKRYKVHNAPTDTMDAWNKVPRQFWSPTMTMLCNGKPFCEIEITEPKTGYDYSTHTSFNASFNANINTNFETVIPLIEEVQGEGTISFTIQ